MVWVDFRKTYGMVPHAQMIKVLKLIATASHGIASLKSTIIDWNTELVLGDTNLGEVNINRGIFQGYSI